MQALHSAIVNVCSVACEVGADSSRFPPEWLFHYRWGNGKGGDRLPDGRKIVFETCAGRTTAWVPEAQKVCGGAFSSVPVSCGCMMSRDCLCVPGTKTVCDNESQSAAMGGGQSHGPVVAGALSGLRT